MLPRAVLAACLLAAIGVAIAHRGRAPVTELRGGRWFDGTAFMSRSMFVSEGRFVERPSSPDSTVDLGGGFVVPPFGEAHNHNLAPSSTLDSLVQRYLQAGVFYVQNPNNLPRDRDALVGRINTASSVDVSFANGGLTGPGGHPSAIATRNISRGQWTARDGDGGFFFSVGTLAIWSGSGATW